MARSLETYGKDRDRSNCHVFAFNKHLVGDFEDGIIWELSRDVFDDGGLPIVWERTLPRIISDFKRLFSANWSINMERGVGLVDGSVPKIYLDWSDDGGHMVQQARGQHRELSATTCQWSCLTVSALPVSGFSVLVGPTASRR